MVQTSGPRPGYCLVMDPRTDALADLSALDGASADLVSALQASRTTCGHTASIVEGGGSVSTAFADARSVDARAVMSDALMTFEQTRYHSRLSLIGLSQQEGLSKVELAELLGISRQLAARWVKESEARAGAGDVAPVAG